MVVALVHIVWIKLCCVARLNSCLFVNNNLSLLQRVTVFTFSLQWFGITTTFGNLSGFTTAVEYRNFDVWLKVQTQANRWLELCINMQPGRWTFSGTSLLVLLVRTENLFNISRQRWQFSADSNMMWKREFLRYNNSSKFATFCQKTNSVKSRRRSLKKTVDLILSQHCICMAFPAVTQGQ